MTTTTITTPNNPLTALLEQAQKEAQKKQQAEAARIEAGKQAIQNAMTAALGDLWETIAPHASVKFERHGGPNLTLGAIYTFRLPDEMRFAPIHLTAHARFDSVDDEWQVSYIFWSYANSVRRHPVEKAASALLDARREWEEADFRRREKQAKKVIAPLESYLVPKEEAEALALVKQATDICPECADKWQQTLARWKNVRADYAEKKREERKQNLISALHAAAIAEDEDTLRDGIETCRREFPEENLFWDRLEADTRAQIRARRSYRQALEAAAQQRIAVLAENRRKATDWLEDISTPIPAYILAYGICAEDGDGNVYADTGGAVVLDDAPDENGYWRVLQHGAVKRVRYLHPVSVTPADAPPVYFGLVPELGQEISYPCTRSRDDIEQAIAALGLTPLPPLPPAPETLDHLSASDILADTRNEYPDAFLDEATYDYDDDFDEADFADDSGW